MDDFFDVKHFMDSHSGKTHRIYTYKRKPCDRIVLQSHLCKQLEGYVLIEKDLRSVLIWLEEINKRDNEPTPLKRDFFGIAKDRDIFNLIKGLFVAALTFYGKCFSKCEGRPVKLERAQLDAEYRELHDLCISYRHNFAAHSGAKKLEHVKIAVVYPTKYKTKVPFKLYKELHQPDMFKSKSESISLSLLVEHVRIIVNKKIDFLAEKIQNEEILANAATLWNKK
jgi:hypothetical protein